MKPDADMERRRRERQLVLFFAAIASKPIRDSLSEEDFLDAQILASFRELLDSKPGQHTDDLLKSLGIERTGSTLDSLLQAVRADAESEQWRRAIEWAGRQVQMEQSVSAEIKDRFRKLSNGDGNEQI